MNLMSTGQICEKSTHKVVFDNQHCDVIEQCTNTVVIRSWYDCSTRMYKMPVTNYNNQTNTVAYSMIPIHCNPTAALCVFQDNCVAVLAFSAYEKQAVPALICYLHVCAGYPTKETWINAINASYYLT